ncbi:MAG: efflux RND transporter permease subunit [candidate division WOR-3 bacterium]
MRISDNAIKRPVTTLMVALALIIFGFIGVSRMSIDLFPNITLPMVVVGTIYPGAGPLEVESEVTDVLEKQLGTVPNLKELTSRTAEGVSIIMMQLEWGTDLDAISADIRDKLNQAEVALPKDAQKPFLLKFDVSMMPVVNITLAGDIPETELRDIADDVATRLQRINGVAAVGISGGAKRQVQIVIDLRELAQYNISLDAITMALKAQNINFPVGSVITPDQKFIIRLIGQYDNIEEIRNTVVGAKGTTPILLRQLAQVNWTSEETKNYARLNEKNAMFMWVQRRPDANTIQVVDAVKAEIKRIEASLPPSVKLQVFWDNSQSIKRSIKNVVTNLILGGILAIFILFLFLRRLRATLFVAFAIPISIFFALFFMYLAGFTVNVLSMAGLAIAVGMVVDNGVVVFESIYRKRESGEDAIKAASIGADEVAMAIIASTLTTLAVFFPLLLLKGLIAVFFKELSWAIIFSLTASLAVALTLIPMLSSRFLKMSAAGTKDKGFIGASEKVYKKLEAFYCKVINWALRHRKTIIFGTLGLFLISLMIVPFLGTEFMPEQRSRFSELVVEMPRGTNLEKTNQAVSILEKHLLEKWQDQLDGMIVQVGEAASIFQEIFGQSGTNYAEINFLLKKDAKITTTEIEQDARRKASEIPGLIVRSSRTGGFTTMFGGGAAVQVEIIGHDINIGDSLNNLLLSLIRDVNGVVDLKSNREKGAPEIQLVIDRVKAANYGLTPYQIGSALRTQIEGNVATQYRLGGKEYDILLRVKQDQRSDISSILGTVINGPMGAVLLKNVVSIKTGSSPLQIEHKNTERIITITGNVVGRSAGKVAQEVNQIVSKLTPPPGFDIKVTGSFEQMQQSFKDIGFAIFIAVILVFMVMASQFESFRDPFIILFTIPLAVIGVIWILFITKTTLSVISGIGILVLAGIVVNNGIVYIDYVNQLRRKQNMQLEEAVAYAGRIRMRPILMTALTTIFGLIPLALKLGEGSELWSPLGRAVIGGMVVSTFLTLVFIPTLYTTFEKRSERKRLSNQVK